MSRLKTTAKAIGCAVALSMIVWVAVVFIQQQQSASQRAATKEDVKRIMLAMHQYHDAYDRFPPAFVVGPDGKRWHSWRALILPYLEPELAKQYRMDEPWNGPHNKAMLANAPEVFRSDCVGPPANATSYFAVVGKRTLWPADQSLGIRDILRGTSNTLVVVEDSKSDIQWLEPRDLLPGEFFHSFYHGKPWTKAQGRVVGFADGAARFLGIQLDRSTLAALLSPQGTDTFKGDNWPADLVDASPEQSVHSPAAAEALPGTAVVAAASVDLDVTRNQLWAASFQMVWDQLKKEVGGPVELGQSMPVLEQLNSASFDLASLSPDASFIARTGVCPTEDAVLLAALRQKFPGIEPPLNKITLTPDQLGLRLYAVVRKTMPFESLFDRFQSPLQFSTGNSVIPVNSFGQDPDDTTGNVDMIEGQVEILDDRGDDNFIVQLNSIGPQKDEIILALVPPDKSLEKTWLAVQERILHPNPKHSRRRLEGLETLQIPILDFSIQKHFAELEGHRIEGFGDPAVLTLAFIDIRLRLDETGADFVSSSELNVIGEFGEEEFKPDRIRRLIFNRSFFIAMKEPHGKQAWFLGWIANGELMESFAGGADAAASP